MKEDDFEMWIDDNLPKFKLLGKYIAFIIENLLQQEKINYLSVSYRTKSKEGILEKVGRKNYKKPRDELTDISGVRVILYLNSDVSKVGDIIESTFNVDSKNSMDNEYRLSSDKMGYRSVHYVCDIGAERNALKENENISGLRCEIQVRTMLQHAWAELAHDRNYKFGAQLPLPIQRKINLFSSMLEIADEGFTEIVNAIEEYKKSIDNNNLDQLSAQEINSVSLYKFVQEISEKIGLKLNPVNDWGGQTTRNVIDELNHLGFHDFNSITRSIPDNYVEACNKYLSENNIYGFLRDIMLIKDFEALSKKDRLNWAIVGNEADSEAEKMRLFYSQFMPAEKATQLVHTFANDNQ